MMIVLSLLLITVPLHGLFWLAIRQERLQLARQYRAAIDRIQVRGVR